MHLLALAAAAASLFLPANIQDQVVEPGTKTRFYKTLGGMDLLGVAARSRFWVKVYGIALYAETNAVKEQLGENSVNTNSLANAVVHADGRRALVMHFVRNVSRDSIQGAFREGIERTIKVSDEKIADDAKTFLDAMTDIKKGDWVELYFENDGAVKLRGNGEEIVSVTNARLQQAILDIYLGLRPIDGNIKKNLLQLID